MKNSYLRVNVIRILLFIALYSLALVFSLWISWNLRFDFQVPNQFLDTIWSSILILVPLKLILLALFKQFSSLIGYFSIRDLVRLALPIILASSLLFIGRFLADFSFMPPRGVLLLDMVLSLFGVSFIRLMMRVYKERLVYITSYKDTESVKKIGIIGAGDLGANLVRELFSSKEIGLVPVCFFDDDKVKFNSLLYGIPIIGKPEIILSSDFVYKLDKLIIALPTTSRSRVKEVLAIARKANLACDIMPSVYDITTGKVSISNLRQVQLQDLLQRDAINLERNSIFKLLNNKIVFVTGAGGSIGSELCRQICLLSPERLVLIERCEAQIFTIEQELIKLGYKGIIMPVVADILDVKTMDYVFSLYEPDFVFHAAAHKHVGLMENQPSEAFRNNTQGTIVLAEKSLECGVSHFILISTDKAINPTSVMGVTKRLAELYIQSLFSENNQSTKFLAVRFGNVLGSSGSVVPIFEKQIHEGGPVTVTHPEVTRFFMTIPESVGLILQSTTLARGGEIFVLDMGKSVKISALAKQLIELHGFKPGVDIKIEFTGLKPGEKLYEEINHEGEHLIKTSHPKILSFISEPINFPEITNKLNLLDQSIVQNSNPHEFKIKIKDIVGEYDPYII